MNNRKVLIIFAIICLVFFPIPLLQALARVLLFILLASFLVSNRIKSKLQIHVEFPEYHFFAHERQEVILRIQNHAEFPAQILGIKDETGGLHTPKGSSTTLSLPSHSQGELSYQIWTERRGVYKLGPILCTGLDPLGFFPWLDSYEIIRNVVVFPRIIDADLAVARGLLGTSRSSTWLEHKNTQETKSSRPYSDGDEYRSIHWKQTAKLGTLMVREYPLERDIPILILLNLRSSDLSQKRKHAHVERCIEACAALLVEAHNIHADCRFSALANESGKILDLRINNTGNGITEVLSELACMQESNSEEPLASILGDIRVSDRPYFIFISPPLQESDYEDLSRFAQTTKNPRWLMLDEQIERKDRISLEDAFSDSVLQIWKLAEHAENTGELYVPK